MSSSAARNKQGHAQNQASDWPFTTKFLEDLLHESFITQRGQIDRWIRSARPILEGWKKNVLEDVGQYNELRRFLTTDEDGWLENIPVMALSITEQEDEGTEVDGDLEKVILDLANVRYQPILYEEEENAERRGLRYRVAYGLLLTTLSELQQGKEYFQKLLGGTVIAPWREENLAPEEDLAPEQSGEGTTEVQQGAPHGLGKRPADTQSPRKGKGRKKKKKNIGRMDEEQWDPDRERDSEVENRHTPEVSAEAAGQVEEEHAQLLDEESADTEPSELEKVKQELEKEKKKVKKLTKLKRKLTKALNQAKKSIESAEKAVAKFDGEDA